MDDSRALRAAAAALRVVATKPAAFENLAFIASCEDALGDLVSESAPALPVEGVTRCS